MPVRRLRALAVALAGAVVAAGLSIYASPQALALDAAEQPVTERCPDRHPDVLLGPRGRCHDLRLPDLDLGPVHLHPGQRHDGAAPVRPQDPAARPGPSSTGGSGPRAPARPGRPRSFSRTTVGAPTLIGPADAAQLTQPDNPVTLSWQPVAGRRLLRRPVRHRPELRRPDHDQERQGVVVRRRRCRPRAPTSGGSAACSRTASSPRGRAAPARCRRPVPTRSRAWPTTPRSRRRHPPDDRQPGAHRRGARLGADQRAPRATRSRSAPTSCSRRTRIVDQVTTVYGTRYSPPKTLDNDQYFWRIRATDAGRLPARLVQPSGLAVQAHLAGPADAAVPAERQPHVDDPLYFQWTPIKHASVYTVHALRAPRPWRRPRRHLHDHAHHARLRRRRPATAGRPPGGTYWWRVTGDRRVLQRRADHRRDRRPDGARSPTHPTWSPRPAPAERHPLRRPYDPDQSLGAPTLTLEAGGRRREVPGHDLGHDHQDRDHGGAQLRATVTCLRHLPLGRADRRRPGLGRRRASPRAPSARSWSIRPPMVPRSDPGHRTGSSSCSPSRTRCPRPARRTRSAPTSASRSGSRRWSGPRSAGSTTTPSTSGPHGGGNFQPLPDDFSWAAGDDTSRHLPRTRASTTGSSWRSARTGPSSPAAPAPSPSSRCPTSRSSPTRPRSAATRSRATSAPGSTPATSSSRRTARTCGRRRCSAGTRRTPRSATTAITFSRDAELTNVISGPPRTSASTMYLDPRRARGQPGRLGVLRGGPALHRRRRTACR